MLLPLPLNEEAVETSVHSNKELVFKQFCSVQRPTFELADKTTHEADLDFSRCLRTKKTFSHLWSEAREAQTTEFCLAHRTTLVLQTKTHRQSDLQKIAVSSPHAWRIRAANQVFDHGLKNIQRILYSFSPSDDMMMLQRCNASCGWHQRCSFTGRCCRENCQVHVIVGVVGILPQHMQSRTQPLHD